MTEQAPKATNMPQHKQIANDMHHAAQSLLNALEQEKCASEERLSRLGRHDPFKSVTGQSSIDNAIDSTRRMLDDLEMLIAGEHPRAHMPLKASFADVKPRAALIATTNPARTIAAI